MIVECGGFKAFGVIPIKPDALRLFKGKGYLFATIAIIVKSAIRIVHPPDQGVAPRSMSRTAQVRRWVRGVHCAVAKQSDS